MRIFSGLVPETDFVHTFEHPAAKTYLMLVHRIYEIRWWNRQESPQEIECLLPQGSQLCASVPEWHRLDEEHDDPVSFGCRVPWIFIYPSFFTRIPQPRPLIIICQKLNLMVIVNHKVSSRELPNDNQIARHRLCPCIRPSPAEVGIRPRCPGIISYEAKVESNWALSEHHASRAVYRP